jgi:hypothetical protein
VNSAEEASYLKRFWIFTAARFHFPTRRRTRHPRHTRCSRKVEALYLRAKKRS